MKATLAKRNGLPLTLTLLLFTGSFAYQCPDLNCADPIGQMICYLHPGGAPVTDTIYTFRCPNDQWCNLEEGKFAWVKASKNSLSTSIEPNDSPINEKYVRKSCEDIANFKQSLSNGRSCDVSAQCVSGVCDSTIGKCKGKGLGESCKNHYECDYQYGCIPDTKFPF